MVNVEFVDDIRFSAGGFSSVHGDRLSSTVEIGLREGSREDTEVGGELSMAELEATRSDYDHVLGAYHDHLGQPVPSYTVEACWKDYDKLPLEEEDPAVFVLDDGTTSSRFRGYPTLVATGRARDTFYQWGFLPVLGAELKF